VRVRSLVVAGDMSSAVDTGKGKVEKMDKLNQSEVKRRMWNVLQNKHGGKFILKENGTTPSPLPLPVEEGKGQEPSPYTVWTKGVEAYVNASAQGSPYNLNKGQVVAGSMLMEIIFDRMVGAFREAIRPYLTDMDYQAVVQTVAHKKKSFVSPFEEFNAVWAAVLALYTTGTYAERVQAEAEMNQHAFKGPVKLGSVTEFIKQARNKYEKAVQLGSTTPFTRF